VLQVASDLHAWGMGQAIYEAYGKRIVDGFKRMVLESNGGRGMQVGDYAQACEVGIGEKDGGR
jgi:hypothetical protein